MTFICILTSFLIVLSIIFLSIFVLDILKNHSFLFYRLYLLSDLQGRQGAHSRTWDPSRTSLGDPRVEGSLSCPGLLVHKLNSNSRRSVRNLDRVATGRRRTLDTFGGVEGTVGPTVPYCHSEDDLSQWSRSLVDDLDLLLFISLYLGVWSKKFFDDPVVVGVYLYF